MQIKHYKLLLSSVPRWGVRARTEKRGGSEAGQDRTIRVGRREVCSGFVNLGRVLKVRRLLMGDSEGTVHRLYGCILEWTQ